MIQKIIALISAITLFFTLSFSAGAVRAEAENALPVLAADSLSAKSAILIDADSGKVLWEKNERQRMGMASTTKIMTALIAAEHCDLQKEVRIPAGAVGVEGSSIYLVAGEVLTMEQLLYALLLASANDAAVAIALTVAGSVEAFADLMNQKAEEMGLHDTHFVNPNGLYDENHYTTAYDLAIISAYALRHPTLREIVSTYKKNIPLNGNDGTRVLVNHNKMLRLYKGAIGMKTGFTKMTGRTLVSAAERDGLRLIAVTLNAPDDWNDHTRMLDYGFERYERVLLTGVKEFTYLFPVTGGTEENLVLTNTWELSMLLEKGHEAPICRVETFYRFTFAPVSRDTAIGTLIYECEGVRVESPLVVASDVEKKIPAKKGLFGWFG